MKRYNVLILGASYGSLLGAKLALAGHDVTLVCLPREVEAINRNGVIIRLPVKGRERPLAVDSRKGSGKLRAAGTDAVKPDEFDLAGLAMQEPQYGSPGVRELLDTITNARIACMSIMNMPPLPYLKRIAGIDAASLARCYTDASVWQSFNRADMTACSPDPQAFRPSDEPLNVLQVTLPTNFKAARFESDSRTQMLRDLEADIDAIRYDAGDGLIELPVKLKVYDSIFVPLAKWAMLMTGNYRCVQKDGLRSIKDAVHSDLEASRAVYDWVRDLCVKLGASRDDLVPFEKYANAANGLVQPSSVSRALFGGAKNIERVDSLVQTLGAQKGMHSDVIDEIVTLVDERLALNRTEAAREEGRPVAGRSVS
jgi:hypothetical protein